MISDVTQTGVKARKSKVKDEVRRFAGDLSQGRIWSQPSLSCTALVMRRECALGDDGLDIPGFRVFLSHPNTQRWLSVVCI